MKTYRIDQVVDGKVYQGGTFCRLKHEAEARAKRRREADRFTGEYRTEYIVVEV